jgi:hypothetical protein
MLPCRIVSSNNKILERSLLKWNGNTLRNTYPMRKIHWDIPKPGYFEVNLVVHNGEDASGEFIHTIQMINVVTCRSEIQAVYGCNFRVMEDGFGRILGRLPFPMIEIHSDNGSEFFNQHLLHFWTEKIADLDLSCNHPYHKNDNRFIEENNHNLIWTYMGHGRLATLAHISNLRELYTDLWCYHNFFRPVMKTV